MTCSVLEAGPLITACLLGTKAVGATSWIHPRHPQAQASHFDMADPHILMAERDEEVRFKLLVTVVLP
jgi:hypothetical protein